MTTLDWVYPGALIWIQDPRTGIRQAALVLVYSHDIRNAWVVLTSQGTKEEVWAWDMYPIKM